MAYTTGWDAYTSANSSCATLTIFQYDILSVLCFFNLMHLVAPHARGSSSMRVGPLLNSPAQL